MGDLANAEQDYEDRVGWVEDQIMDIRAQADEDRISTENTLLSMAREVAKLTALFDEANPAPEPEPAPADPEPEPQPVFSTGDTHAVDSHVHVVRPRSGETITKYNFRCWLAHRGQQI